MLKLLSDENFHGDIVKGLRRHYSEVDIVRVQDVDYPASRMLTYWNGRPKKGVFY